MQKLTLRECVRLAHLPERPFGGLSEDDMNPRGLFAALLWIYRNSPASVNNPGFIVAMQTYVIRSAREEGDRTLTVLTEHCCAMADHKRNEINHELWNKVKETSFFLSLIMTQSSWPRST